MKNIRDSKGLYWGLIIAFFVLYMCVGFVSTLHSITFFQLANTLWMAVLLGITYEVGQAAVLFSILMSKNNQSLLPWALMFLLTALQVTANVYASFKFMDNSQSMDWTFWQRSILFWMETDDPEMFKVVISWITGALLPVVALGMTALVAENLKLKDEEENKKEPQPLPPGPPKPSQKIEDRSDEINFDDGLDDTEPPPRNEQLENFAEALLNNKVAEESESEKKASINKEGVIEVSPQFDINVRRVQPERISDMEQFESPLEQEKGSTFGIETPKIDRGLFVNDPQEGTAKFPKKPINNQRGWHLKREFTDENGDVYNYGLLKPKLEVPRRKEPILPPKKDQG